jgi:hypothetical protein
MNPLPVTADPLLEPADACPLFAAAPLWAPGTGELSEQADAAVTGSRNTQTTSVRLDQFMWHLRDDACRDAQRTTLGTLCWLVITLERAGVSRHHCDVPKDGTPP